MSGPRFEHLPGGGASWSDEDLLELVLDPERRAGEASPVADPRFAELEGFVARCRTACATLDAAAPEREADLVARVLARTTREDLTWRGDLGLLRRFVGQRLRSSLALRVAAASLLFHLFALPVVAWYGLHRAEPEPPVIRFAPARPPVPVEEPEPDPQLAAEPLADGLALGPLEWGARYVENSLHWGRYTRVAAAVPALPPPRVDDPDGLVALRARIALAGGAQASAAPGDPAAGSALGGALRAELALDRVLSTGRAPAGMAEALDALAAEARLGTAGGRLALAALARAQSYGLLPTHAADRLGQERLALAADDPDRALLVREGEARRVAPLDPRWLALCARAAEQAGWPADVVAALRAR